MIHPLLITFLYLLCTTGCVVLGCSGWPVTAACALGAGFVAGVAHLNITLVK